MIIEFFGFPGSGKTTVANQLIVDLRNKKIDYVRGTFDHQSKPKRVFNKVFYSLLCLFIRPRFYFKNLLFFFNFKSNNLKNIPDFLNITYLYARYATLKDSDRIIIFDQGLFQAYLSVVSFSKDGTSYNTNKIFKYVEKIILVSVEFNEIIERLSLRDNSKGKSRVQKGDSKELNRLYNIFMNVKNRLVTIHCKQVMHVNGGITPSENAALIIQNLSNDSN